MSEWTNDIHTMHAWICKKDKISISVMIFWIGFTVMVPNEGSPYNASCTSLVCTKT